MCEVRMKALKNVSVPRVKIILSNYYFQAQKLTFTLKIQVEINQKDSLIIYNHIYIYIYIYIPT